MANKSQSYFNSNKKNHRMLLKGKMPRGYRKTLSKEFGVSEVMVDKVLSGDREGSDIIKRAYEICIDFNRKISDVKNEINELIAQVAIIPERK